MQYLSRQFRFAVRILLAALVGLGVSSAEDAVALDVHVYDEETGEFVEREADEREELEGEGIERPQTEVPETLEVTFETIEVSIRLGELTIDYTIPEKDWDRLQNTEAVPYFQVLLPSSYNPPYYSYAYKRRLETRSGEVQFPDWLDTSEADKVGVCLMAARPGDQLGLGRGYFCKQPRLFEMGAASEAAAMTFTLQRRGRSVYHPLFPWREATPPGAEKLVPNRLNPR